MHFSESSSTILTMTQRYGVDFSVRTFTQFGRHYVERTQKILVTDQLDAQILVL